MNKLVKGDRLSGRAGSPVRRHVALKIIKLGMGRVIARFEALNGRRWPPDIAKVDAGATVIQWCAVELTLLRFELFAARPSSHIRKGNHHRDLKPSNILVADWMAGRRPKLLTSGLPRSVHGRAATDNGL
ncbi:MAG: hypothetical protein V9H26_05635 [Verrucomicrobiota bacterium]